MSTRNVTTQAKLDAALADAVDHIIIKSPPGVWLTVTGAGSSHVEARGSSSVVARDSSSVVARESSRVVARDSSHVDAGDSSSVVARGSSSVVAWDSSSVVALDSSSVVARESSRVVALDSSSVEASTHVAVHLHSRRATVSGGVVIDIAALDVSDPTTWCDYHGVRISDGKAIVYKAVSRELVAGQGRLPTTYTIGATIEAADWKPSRTCGHGLHFGPSPRHAVIYYQGDEDRSECRFLACEIDVATAVPLDDKIKAPSCLVLHEVDIDGNAVSA